MCSTKSSHQLNDEQPEKLLTYRATAEASSAGRDTMPDFMKADRGRGLETVEDIAWMGDDGKLDSDALLTDRGYDPLPELHYILLAIIDAVQEPAKSGASREVRLETALAALTGSMRGRRGMNKKDDYELLIQIAWEYQRRFWADDCASPEIDPIIREAVDRLSPGDPRRNMATVASVVTRLRRKFVRDKNLYIVRATEQMDPRRMDKLYAIHDILRRMQDLGIHVDLSVLRPSIVVTDPIAP